MWLHKLNLADVFHSDLPWPDKRAAIADRMSRLRLDGYAADALSDLVENVRTTESPDAFDEVWDAFYNLADEERVWVVTR